VRSIAIVIGITAVGVLGVAAPAVADDGLGSADCKQGPSPVCELQASKGGRDGMPRGNLGNGNRNPGRSGSGNDSNNDSNGGSDDNGGDTGFSGRHLGLAKCSYVLSDYQPPHGGALSVAYIGLVNPGGARVVPAVGIRPAARAVALAEPAGGSASGQQGAWYVWECTTSGFRDAKYRPPVWIANGPHSGAAGLPSPVELARRARKQLRLPTPMIAANPAGEQLVTLPTWLWLSGGWAPMSATASVGDVSVTAVATPRSVSWSMGDGTTLTCTGPGTPFRSGSDPTSASPDCGHTYRSSSAGQAGQAFAVSATVHWTVRWSGAGQGGTFPDLTTTSTAALRVAEVQALNTGGG
jgi:hypothetical protein